ncbi:MAG TPA: hypothetical protein GXX72_06950 [Clostridiaceae bacterium]|nr:hypothetical protein [Clostridiaceae bacterium]
MAQLNMFGDEIVKKEEKKVKKDLRPVEKIPDSKSFMVCYAGHKIEVSLAERLENIRLAKELKKEGESGELEILRQKLEKDFPELSENRVKWHWEIQDKDSNEPFVIVPVVSAGKKG